MPVLILGSAPFSSSRRMTSMSFAFAANRNAVEPTSRLRYRAPDHRGSMSVFRPLTSAPCFRSDLMTRSRSMLTEMNSSLMCQLATCTAACSGLPQLLLAPFPPSVPTSRS